MQTLFFNSLLAIGSLSTKKIWISCSLFYLLTKLPRTRAVLLGGQGWHLPTQFFRDQRQKSLKNAKFLQLLFTYHRICHNLRSRPPSFYKIAPPLISNKRDKTKDFKISKRLLWLYHMRLPSYSYITRNSPLISPQLPCFCP